MARISYRRRRRFGRLADLTIALAMLGVLAVVAVWITGMNAAEVSGEAHIVDGDTVVIDGIRIRLEGIDAPEFDQICHNSQELEYPCGRSALAHLKSLSKGRPMRCEGWQHDRYDRLLAICKSGGSDLNAAMVRSGWALSFGQYGPHENRARREGIGVWQGTFERPSSWRHIQGKAHEIGHGGIGMLVSTLRSLIRL